MKFTRCMRIASVSALAAVAACSGQGQGAQVTARPTAPQSCHFQNGQPYNVAVRDLTRWRLQRGKVVSDEEVQPLFQGATFRVIDTERRPDNTGHRMVWNKVVFELLLAHPVGRKSDFVACSTTFLPAAEVSDATCRAVPTFRHLTGASRPTGVPYYEVPGHGPDFRIGRVPRKGAVDQTAEVSCPGEPATDWTAFHWQGTVKRESATIDGYLLRSTG